MVYYSNLRRVRGCQLEYITILDVPQAGSLPSMGCLKFINLKYPCVLLFHSTPPTYNLSKYLVKLLSPLVGNTSAAIWNSTDFAASFIQQEHLNPNEILVSFDSGVARILRKGMLSSDFHPEVASSAHAQ